MGSFNKRKTYVTFRYKMDVYDETYYREEFMDIKLKHPNYIYYLIENQSMIEYIDPLETEGLLYNKK